MFLVLAAQFYVGLCTGSAENKFSAAAKRALDVTTGVLFAMVLAVKDYCFGSSSGSKAKSDHSLLLQEAQHAQAR